MSKTVLLSVQQELLCSQIREFLDGAGYRVLEAPTDAATADVLRDSPVDLLLADRPTDSVPVLVRAVRGLYAVKMLLISGEPEYVTRVLLPDEEVGFIEKPFSWRELRHKIDDLLEPATLAACGY